MRTLVYATAIVVWISWVAGLVYGAAAGIRYRRRRRRARARDGRLRSVE